MNEEGKEEEILTDNDKALIEEAYAFKDYSRWQRVEAMVKRADTKKAKELLHSRASWLYHTDEYFAGML